MTTTTAPFDLRLEFSDPLRRAAMTLLRRPLERVLGLDLLNHHYATLEKQPDTPFADRALKSLGISYHVSPGDLARIPRTGPLIIVANHPFGGLDGLILTALLQQVRPDVKLMANFLLARIPELRDSLLFVNPFAGNATNNLAGLRQSIAHVKNGGALIVFPAGEVSHINLRQRAVIDPPWSNTIARLVQITKATVLPIFFHGNNSRLFNLLGLLHPRLRTALLPRELLSKQNTRIHLEIGTPISHARLEKFDTPADLTAYLRLRTLILQTRKADTLHGKPRSLSNASPVAPQRDPGLLIDEIQSLSPDHRLLDSADYAVYLARAREIPEALHEIGRLREITFRDTHEGTGKPLDLDRFDRTYLHLFCWNKQKHEIVGAYRLGLTDELLQQGGVDALYTRTLFKFDSKLLQQGGPAIELGRSFVRAEYQRSYSPLLLLWKGIGAVIAANPRYHVLFGPVSINNQYHSMSRQLIMTFLRTTASSHLAGLIRASNPPRLGPLRAASMEGYSAVVRDIDEVSDLVQEIESDRKGIPVLLRQYMKLSARLLGFNVDPDFGDVLDGLLLVDLHQTDPHLVERFCGKQYAASLAKK